MAIIDIPGAFLSAEADEEVIMTFCSRLVELMAMVAPSVYQQYIKTGENGKKILYIRLLCVLFGMMQSALLFYEKLWNNLQSLGFKLNPYDPCIANKLIKVKQFTIAWNVDDLNR